MFLGVACIALLQLIFCRSFIFQQEKCHHKSDCHCPENLEAECDEEKCICHPVKCSEDSDCHCKDGNFHANCQNWGYGSYCSDCNFQAPHINQTTTSPTAQSTTAAVSTSTLVPTPAPPQSNCSVFDPILHRCHDSSACFLPNMLEVLCPDPQQASCVASITEDLPFPAPPIYQTTTSPTAPSTTAAVSTSTLVPTPAKPQSNCSEFDSTLHGCYDNSACNLTHVLEVICPDPKEAKYCPTKCGCCPCGC